MVIHWRLGLRGALCCHLLEDFEACQIGSVNGIRQHILHLYRISFHNVLSSLFCLSLQCSPWFSIFTASLHWRQLGCNCRMGGILPIEIRYSIFIFLPVSLFTPFTDLTFKTGSQFGYTLFLKETRKSAKSVAKFLTAKSTKKSPFWSWQKSVTVLVAISELVSCESPST